MKRIYFFLNLMVIAVCSLCLIAGLIDGSLKVDQICIFLVLILIFFFVAKKTYDEIVFIRSAEETLKSEPEGTVIVAQLNDKIQPLDRGDRYEDPLNKVLEEKGIGEVSGGGTMTSKEKEIEYCDIEISLQVTVNQAIGTIQTTLESLGAPKGSKLILESENGREIPFGKLEGLGVYLNGTDLPAEVYQKSDVNFVISEFKRLLETEGEIHGHWQGPKETSIYIYGNSFDEMKRRLAEFMGSDPLCQKARLVRIA